MKTRYNLTIEEKHSDIEILGNSLRSKGFEFDTQYSWENGEIITSKNPTVRSSSYSTDTKVLEGNYIRINNLRYWEDSDYKSLLEAIELANTMTSEYNFEYGDITDYEVDIDNDRSWPASFTFYSHKK